MKTTITIILLYNYPHRNFNIDFLNLLHRLILISFVQFFIKKIVQYYTKIIIILNKAVSSSFI